MCFCCSLLNHNSWELSLKLWTFLLLLPRRVFHNEWYLFFSFFFFISWRLITLQYCSGFCHTLTRISYGFTCIPHPDPPSHIPLCPIPLGLPSAPGPSTCLMHPTWAGEQWMIPIFKKFKYPKENINIKNLE